MAISIDSDMIQNLLRFFKHAATMTAGWLVRVFDHTANWVTQLSWWKFFLFAILILIAGGIMQDVLFSPEPHSIVIKNRSSQTDGKKSGTGQGETDIRIDGSGIHITKNKRTATSSGTGIDSATPAAPAPAASEPDIHLSLPPEIGKDVSNAVEEAITGATEQQAVRYRRNSSAWFMNFILLLLVGLFGTKALMGGKKRAEAKAAAANAVAKREMLQRQVTEAKMQMMQAQVEPHFLFNTLASVEHLIETDPPRASAMQRSLIQYLRAVLPQMRENAATNLGRETDMVRAYLNLLKMRMEERLTTDVNIPEGLRSAAFPHMMLQSLVENAIKHGLESKPEGGTLRILAEVANNKLRVTVADNGLGFGAIPSNGTGLGLQSIRERLKLLHGDQGQLIIAPNSPSGVCATIEIPYRLASQ